MFLISINFVLIFVKGTVLLAQKIWTLTLFSDIFFEDTWLRHSLIGKFLPTKLESDCKFYGIDLYYVLIKETKIFLPSDIKNRQMLIQVVALLCKKKVYTLYCNMNILDA